MSKERKRRKSLNAGTPTTPKTKYHVDDNMFATPKAHYIQDDDSDSSPYSLSFSQRVGVEVTWDEKSRPTPFKSKKKYERRDTESPPTKSYVDPVEPMASESPKGLYKFLLGLERRRITNQIEDDFERIDDESTIEETSNHTNNGTNCINAVEQAEAAKSNICNSPNFKQLLNDSEDMNLMLCSQRIEQEVCSRPAPVLQGLASKGFAEFFSSDNDDDLLLALDVPDSLDKKLPQKSSFARHKSIAIQPNSSLTVPSSNSNSGSSAVNSQTKPATSIPTVKPLTPTTTMVPNLVRHKSMPSPNLTSSARKCSAEEIEIKRRNALAKLKLRKQRLTKK